VRDVDWYAEAHAYDVLFGWDPGVERAFVLGASERWGRGPPAAVFEPFCGTGRLLRTMPGVAVGLDLNPAMVRYARRTCPRVVVADAARLPLAAEAFDLGYALIDSFRHLPTEEAARSALEGAARALRPGGVFVLGLDVSGGLDPEESTEEWSKRRDDTLVEGTIRCLGDIDRDARRETMEVRLVIRQDGRKRREVVSRAPLRTYTAEQLRALVASVPALELVETFDRTYELDRPKALEAVDGSAVLVLRRRT
jgi:SAM-dependent methyltransferase